MNTEYIIFFTILFLLNIFLAFNFDKYSNFFKIVDKPDDLRKLHKKETKVFGGTIILLNLLFTMIFFLIFDYDLIDQIFDDKKKLIIFAFTVLLIFLTGIYDDWINLPPINKTIILILVLSISLYLDKNLITDINISFYKIIFLNKFAIFFTIFCYLVFMNAFNMLDGINLQTGFYSIFLTIFLIINDLNIIFGITLIIAIFTYLKLNHQNKIFLGDNGSLLLSFLFSYLFIKLYNQGKIIYSDDILIVLLIPGLEVIRLTLKRIISNKSILRPDRNHIHHLITFKNKPYIGFLLIQFILIFPYSITYLIPNNLYVIILSVIVYSFVIYLFSKK